MTNIVILTESSIEKKAVRSLLADPNVASVQHQATRISYRDDDGELHHHTVDLLVTLKDGTTIGYVVKLETAAIKQDTRGLVEKLSAQVPSTKVDRLQLVTSRQLPAWADRNARLLISVRRDRRTFADAQLAEIAPELVKPIRIGDLTERLGGGHEGFRPVVRAIAAGTLKYLGVGVIDENGKVQFSGEVKPDVDLSTPVPKHFGPPPVILRRKTKPKPQRRASYRTK